MHVQRETRCAPKTINFDLITELANAAEAPEGVPFWLIQRARELSKHLQN
jgi:hypothetical protein